MSAPRGSKPSPMCRTLEEIGDSSEEKNKIVMGGITILLLNCFASLNPQRNLAQVVFG